MGEVYEYSQSVNSNNIAAMLQHSDVLKVVVRNLKKLNRDIKVNPATVHGIIENEIIKRNFLDEAESLLAKKQLFKKLK